MGGNWILFGLWIVKLSKREVLLMGGFNIHECGGSAFFPPMFPTARTLINDHLHNGTYHCLVLFFPWQELILPILNMFYYSTPHFPIPTGALLDFLSTKSSYSHYRVF